MRSRQAILFFSPAGRAVPDFVTAWVNGKHMPVITLPQAAAGWKSGCCALPPTLVVVDADSAGDEGMQLCARLKGRRAYTAIVAARRRHQPPRDGRGAAAGSRPGRTK